MKKVMIMFLVLVLPSSLALAQVDPNAGWIELYGDVGGTDCNIVDTAAGLLNVYVFHVHPADPAGTSGTAVQFQALMPACMVGASYLSDTGVFPVTVGDSQVGVAVGYGACLSTPTHVLTVNYFGAGTSTACCSLEVTPQPGPDIVGVVDCADNLLQGVGLISTVNGDPIACPCGVIAVEETTWGHIKSLYNGQ